MTYEFQQTVTSGSQLGSYSLACMHAPANTKNIEVGQTRGQSNALAKVTEFRNALIHLLIVQAIESGSFLTQSLLLPLHCEDYRQ